MSYMFSDCSSLISLELRKFDTANVTKMTQMFKGCSGLTSLDLSSFNTENVTDFHNMFYDCQNLTVLNNFNLSLDNVYDMKFMFLGCDNLRTVIFGEALKDFNKIIDEINNSTLVFVNESTTVSKDIPNVVVGNMCEHLVIDYYGYNNQLHWFAPRNFTANKVTINRVLEKDRPYTLYLPFAMDAAQYGAFYAGGVLNETGDMVTFSKVTDSQTAADTPYMFIPNDNFENGISIEGPVEVINLSGETDNVGLQGVSNVKIFTAEEEAQKIYYGWADGAFLWAKEGAKVDACRAYFRLPASAAAKAPARIKAIFGDDTTGVNEIDSETDGLDSPIFNINGQRVGNEYRGILIKKGKKTANFTR